jgi:hypothetical protein
MRPPASQLSPQFQRLLQFSPTEKEFQFFAWAWSTASNSSGLFFHEKLRLRKTASLGYDFCIASNSDGNKTKKEIAVAPNEVLLRVPASLWRPYSADHALIQFEKLSPDTFKALLALSQRLLPGAEVQRKKEREKKDYL